MTRKISERQIASMFGDQQLAKLVIDIKGWGGTSDDKNDFEYWHKRALRAPKDSPLRIEATIEMSKKAITVDQHQATADLFNRESDQHLAEIEKIYNLSEDHEVLYWCLCRIKEDSKLYKEIVIKMFKVAITHKQWCTNFHNSITAEQKSIAVNELFTKASTQFEWLTNCTVFSRDPEKHSICFKKVRALNTTEIECVQTFLNGNLTDEEKEQILDDIFFNNKITFENLSSLRFNVSNASQISKIGNRIIAKMKKIGKFVDWKEEYNAMHTCSSWRKTVFEECLRTGDYRELQNFSHHLFSDAEDKCILKALFTKANNLQKGDVYWQAHNFPDLQQEFLTQIAESI